MTIDEQIKLFESNAEFERKDGDLQGCLNFRQLAEWLKDYKRLLGAIEDIRAEIDEQIIPRSSYTDKQKKQVIEIIDRHISGKERDENI